jgi:hypothetical protein
VAQSRNLAPEARRVVYAFCRFAMEAASQDVITRRLLHEGRASDEIEDQLQRPTTLLMWLALVLLRDAGRAGDVMTHLNSRWPWAADAVATCNRGSHGAIGGGMLDTIRVVERLTTSMGEGDGGHR